MRYARSLARWVRGSVRTLRRNARSRYRRRARIRHGRLNWAILTSAPAGPAGLRWGDTAFASDLAEALETRGQHTSVVPLGSAVENADDVDVRIVLRGLHRIDPSPVGINYLWIISHPDEITAEEAHAGWTRVFAASLTWSRLAEFHATPLLQAASTRRFLPGPSNPELTEDVLFVGTSRRQERPVIRDAIEAGARLGIYGHDWEGFVPAEAIRREGLEFARVPDAYRSARIILNDHWEDMRTGGFLSNRLFDATFVGAHVVSDHVNGIDEIFGGLVRTYTSLDDLRMLLGDESGWPDSSDRAQIAARIRELHSFDARAGFLIECATADSRRRGRVAMPRLSDGPARVP
jgi:hypothetical protein